MENFDKKQKIFIIFFIVIFILVLLYTIWSFINSKNSYIDVDEDLMIKTENNINSSNDINNAIQASSEKIIVYIIGSVKNPGIYELDVDSRVSDAVNSAGGLLDDADISKINLAFKLEDGQKITIPSINDDLDDDSSYEDFISQDSGNIISDTSSNSSTKKVNLNTASQTELETLPGIGPSTALKIINYRNENGKFSSIEDIKKVPGIGDSKFNNLKEYVSV